MRLRPLLLAAAATAAVAGSVPAHAAALPVCAAHLELAATGTTSNCSTNPIPVLNGGAQRLLTVEVVTGTVNATLQCGGSVTGPHFVSGPVEQTFALSEGGRGCWVTLTAASAGTTAVATSTFVYELA
jgi:hypothetical protein